MQRRYLAMIAVLALLVLTACSSGTGGSVSAVEGAEWKLVDASVNTADLGAAGITATFDDDEVAGTGGVNSYSAPCTLESDGSMEVGDITSTLIAGSDEANAAEAAYFELLKSSVTWEIEDGRLTLLDESGIGYLVFEQ